MIVHLQEALAAAGDRQSHGTLRAIQLPQWLRAAGLVDQRQKPTLTHILNHPDFQYRAIQTVFVGRVP